MANEYNSDGISNDDVRASDPVSRDVDGEM